MTPVSHVRSGSPDPIGPPDPGAGHTPTWSWEDVSGLDRLRVVPPTSPPTGVVVAPGSKSLTNRALLLAALADGPSRLTGALDATDTRLMIAALRRCDVRVDLGDDATTLDVSGLGGGPRVVHDPDTPIDVGTSGTVSRFLGAVLAASAVTARLDGTPRMRERPMAQLLDVLASQGATITTPGRPGHLPATIHGAKLAGGEVEVDRPASSQVVSALVLSGLLAAAPTRIVLPHGTPARPYVDMTLATLTAFGCRARWVPDQGVDVLEVEPFVPTAREWPIEPDASAATYAWALAALHGGDLTVSGLGADSLQGDVAFAQVIARMGAAVEVATDHVRVVGTGDLRGIDVDLTELPDPGLTLAVMALHARGTTRIRGVAVHRHHETDRIAAAATELRKLGADVVEHDDGLDITPPEVVTSGVVVDTWLDHRMAMAFALAGDVVVDDPGCVDKTWPNYFAMLDGFDMVQPA